MATRSAERFKRPVIALLAKRAAHRCSNPDCRAITTGAAVKASGIVNVGEAAHIYGAHPGSARYDPKMASAARSDIANAIWLCSNCHKQVDDDEAKFPAGLLFEWVKEHELEVGRMVGKAGAEVRRKYEDRYLEEFGKLSYRAERLLIQKTDFWEYRLTSEMLRYEMAPILQRWRALERGLYMRPLNRILNEDFLRWIDLRIKEILHIVSAFGELFNVEFARSWGIPGVAGDAGEIVATTRLYAEMCRCALEWEEMVRFASVDEIFDEVLSLFPGIAGYLIDEAAKAPAFLSEILLQPNPAGEFNLKIVLELPEGWPEQVADAQNRAIEAYLAEKEAVAFD
ncbi:hypothetical protein [Novosphingobium sp.]|jgi:hypothetical protein|uniref:hypothetical protein n=1 Tax=Novosphingobium sp. TaxID=1874826 RepID=UPI002FE35AE4